MSCDTLRNRDRKVLGKESVISALRELEAKGSRISREVEMVRILGNNELACDILDGFMMGASSSVFRENNG